MHRGEDCWPQLLQLRKRCFVDRQDYQVPTYQEMEWDSFDTPYTLYGLWRDQEGVPGACFRLIPTSQRYMIPELWPNLLDGEAPRCPKSWELSRMGIDDRLPLAGRKLAIAAVVAGVIEAADHHGIERLIFCSNPTIVRRLFKGIAEVLPLGPEAQLERHWVQCGAIVINQESIARARQIHQGVKVTRL